MILHAEVVEVEVGVEVVVAGEGGGVVGAVTEGSQKSECPYAPVMCEW